jgi:hypothetical protein
MAKRVQSPAQRAAAKRNLRKGNPQAFTKNSQEAPRDSQEAPRDPPKDSQGAPGDPPERQTVRVRRPPAAKAKPRKPAARRVPPRAAPAEPAKRGDGGGFFGGLLKGFSGE